MEQILIIEDDIGLNQGLCKALQSENRKVVSCQNLKTAREQLMCGGISLVLLDINLPDGSGLDLLSEIKNTNTQTLVILLTANDTDMDIVAGLEQGADDYITKPFSLAVLRARVNTQLRKAINKPTPPSYNFGNYTFDFDNMKFTANGIEVELSKTEQKLLRILVENQGNIISRSTLVDHIWTDGAEYVDENALSVTVKRLRDKLNAYDNIKTIYGLGYRWENSHE
jgi:DNA-binding response OmpR family regulator